MRRYAWLFDQRFDALRASFEAILLPAGRALAIPINAHEEFPDATPAAESNAPVELRQRTPEDTNRAFSSRWGAGERWGHDDESPLPLASFTMDGVDDLAGISAFGVRGDLVHTLSDKSFQYTLFRDAGLPVPDFTILPADSLVEDAARLLNDGPVLLQPAHSAGGEQATLARHLVDLADFRERVATSAAVVAARFKPDCRTLSGNAIVTRDGRVLTLGITELLQDGFRFDGFIFPSFESADATHAIESVTVRVGELLRERGYWGYFTADVLLRADGELFLTESNVRFSGEAAFIAAATSHNVFELMAGTVRPSGVLSCRSDQRIVVTKIRPRLGQIAAPIDGPDEMSFLREEADAFRVGYHRESVRVIDAHFLGLAGVRMRAPHGRADALRFYETARRPC